MKRLILSLLILTVMMAATYCGGPGGKRGKTGKDGDKKDKKETEAVPVQVTTPTRGDISAFLLFSSNVDAEKIVDIYPMTGGIIKKIIRDEGDTVKKDEKLALLDEREAVINEERSRINYEQLKQELERFSALYEKKMVSLDDFEKLKYRAAAAKLDWKHKKLLLSYTRITSPISGVVTKRHIKEGNKINTSQLAFSVVQVKEKIAVVNIPGQEQGQISLGQEAKIIPGTGNVKAVDGKVKRISPAIDPESGTFKVTIGIRDPENTLAVGRFVNVKIIKDVHQKALLLTKEALVYEGGKVFVFVVDEDKKVKKRLVGIGFEESNRVEILLGLSEKDQVVTAGKRSLKNGTLVKIVEPVFS